MIPLVSLVEEIRLVRQWVRQYQDALLPSKQLAVKLGAMIETPAAALSSDLLAKECDFLSFGTNDLTQLALGLSREDYPPVLRAYQQQDLLEKDPFQTLHPTVFQFIRDAAVRAKQTNSSIAIGICGSHATNSQMIELCKEGLVDYLSIPQQRLLQVKLQSIQSL
jgi:pyruvate,orthophosphate dikinase